MHSHSKRQLQPFCKQHRMYKTGLLGCNLNRNDPLLSMQQSLVTITIKIQKCPSPQDVQQGATSFEIYPAHSDLFSVPIVLPLTEYCINSLYLWSHSLLNLASFTQHNTFVIHYAFNVPVVLFCYWLVFWDLQEYLVANQRIISIVSRLTRILAFIFYVNPHPRIFSHLFSGRMEKRERQKLHINWLPPAGAPARAVEELATKGTYP